MAVYHILKDGTILQDITGHIVKLEDAGPLYQFMSTLTLKPDTKTNTYKLTKAEV